MSKKVFKIIDISFGWAIFIVAAIVYLMTIEPTVSFWDCGEFISSSNKLQVGHPPGAPFFMLIARVASMFATDVTQVAKMVNGTSAIFSALTIMFLFWTIVFFAKKLLVKNDNYSIGNVIAIIASGVVGSLAYTFSDTFWFSAVEAEVYAMSSFFTAIVFWAILKWSQVDEKITSYRWILLIALLTGAALGVHLLNLLKIPAIAFVIYYKNQKKDLSSKAKFGYFVLTALLSVLAIAIIMWGIIPGVGVVAADFELFFVNVCGLPFHTGLIIWIIITAAALALSIFVTHRNIKVLNIVVPSLALLLTGAPLFTGSTVLNILIVIAFIIVIVVMVKKERLQILNLIMTAVTCIMIGYSCYAIVVIRSNANPSMDQNNPDDAFSLLYYLNREQYGDRPLLYGQYYDAAPTNESKEGTDIYAKVDSKYKLMGNNRKQVYRSEDCMVFPRMYSPDETHKDVYESYGGIKSGKKPTFGNNIQFFFSYQMHWMYWRYFMWNFAGRQNDIQGFGNSVHGNWISGIAPLDNSRLGNQDLLPEYLKENKAHNSYFMLPLLLGLIGLAFHFMKDQKNAFVVLLLFVLTGIAIVVYLNQAPDQPRERDYAYAASCFAFTIWIGLGVTALFSLFKKIIKNSPISATLAFVLCIPVPLRMASENWDDHDRSNRYVCHDFGRNYLETCAPNAILFTFGDNDTFSVWYAQEVEGIRPDVKVCCLPYLNSDWYINQMKSKYYEADPMPLSIQDDKYISSTRDVQYFRGQGKSNKYISLPALIKELTENTAVTYENESIYVYDNRNYYIKVDKDAVVASGTVAPEDIDKIDTLIKVKMNTGNILKNELVILDFINKNNWERPIYFTGSNSRSLCGLDNYLQNEGFAYRLVPIKSDKSARINTDVLYNNMINKYT